MMHFAERAPWWNRGRSEENGKEERWLGGWQGSGKERRAVNRVGRGNRREGKRERRRGKREREGERGRKRKRKREGMEGGSRIPYTVTFVKGWLSPYTGNVRDGRYLYRVQLKNQECRFLSRLLYTPVVMGGTNTTRKWSPARCTRTRGRETSPLLRTAFGNPSWKPAWWPAFGFERACESIKDT